MGIIFFLKKKKKKKKKRDRLPNVGHRTVDLQRLDLPAQSLDALLLIKVYHDFYWIDAGPKAEWPKMDAAVVLDQLTRVLNRAASWCSRITPRRRHGQCRCRDAPPHRRGLYRARFEKRGFKLVGKSDLLRRPQDERTLVSYTSPGLGKTDRFVLVFRKNAS